MLISKGMYRLTNPKYNNTKVKLYSDGKHIVCYSLHSSDGERDSRLYTYVLHKLQDTIFSMIPRAINSLIIKCRIKQLIKEELI